MSLVFDASAKTANGKSLNELLHVGPTLQNKIQEQLIRFRTKKIVASSDISKMYLQIKIKPEARDFLRVLWKEPGSQGPPKIYRFTNLIFGQTDTPFQAQHVLQKHAMNQRSESNNPQEREAIESILEDFYIDDLVSGGHSPEEVVDKQNQINFILKKRPVSD